jgi:hypothetical protein
VRDAGYFGTPVVLVGERQEGRETDAHVRSVPPVAGSIADAVRSQLKHGRYPASALYGDGFVAERIAKALAMLQPYRQKRLHYIYDADGSGKDKADANPRNRNGAWGLERDTQKKYRAANGKTATGLHG